MLPIVWQPHFYMLRNHVRIYLEAAATFSYNISSTYENEQARANGSAAGKATIPSSSRATTAGATDWRAAAASLS